MDAQNTDPTHHQYKIFFATNRKPLPVDGTGAIPGFADEPWPAGGANLRFGTVTIDVASGLNNDASVVAGSIAVAPESLFDQNPTYQVGSTQVFDNIRSIMKTDNTIDPRQQIIVFIPGFNNGWEDSIKRAGVIADLYSDMGNGRKALVFLFSWPSTGASVLGAPIPFTSYEHDRKAVAASGLAGARLLGIFHAYVQGLIKAAGDKAPRADLCDAKMHLIVHSMGHQVLSHTLAVLPGIVPDRVGRMFDQVVLAAADEDANALDAIIPGKLGETGSLLPLVGLSRRITVYANQDDWILNALSRYTKQNGRRLGVDGPDTYPYPAPVSKVDVIPVVPILQDIQQHQYYRRVQAVVDDIRMVLRGTSQDEIGMRKMVMAQRYRLSVPSS